MSCYFCDAPCGTVVRYYNHFEERATRLGCCLPCSQKKVAVPLGYECGVVKGRARKQRERAPKIRRQRVAAAGEESTFELDAAMTQCATMIVRVHSFLAR